MKQLVRNPRYWTQAALIAALYTALVLAFQPISFGTVQLRVAEAMCILAYFTPAALPGLTVGCLLANAVGLSTGATIAFDLLFGTAATLLATLVALQLRNHKWLLPLPSVLFNGLIVGWEVHTFFTPEISLWLCMVYVAAGQVLACYALGMPLLFFLDRSKGFQKLTALPPVQEIR